MCNYFFLTFNKKTIFKIYFMIILRKILAPTINLEFIYERAKLKKKNIKKSILILLKYNSINLSHLFHIPKINL